MSTKENKYVFIVEDNELYSMMLDYILSQNSTYQFIRYRTGEECIKNLYLEPCIIILDYGLPGINGYETLLEVKKQKPGTHVIILSVNRDVGVVEKLLRAGADDYVLKQGHGETQIIEKIETILKKDAVDKNIFRRMRNKSVFQKALVILFFIVLSLGLLFFKGQIS